MKRWRDREMSWIEEHDVKFRKNKKLKQTKQANSVTSNHTSQATTWQKVLGPPEKKN